jgi:hypothetical protein
MAEQPSDRVAEAPQLNDWEFQESLPSVAHAYATLQPTFNQTYTVTITMTTQNSLQATSCHMLTEAPTL